MHELKDLPVGGAELLFRKPVSEVFQAFVDPAWTTQFWFTKSTGVLEAGKSVDWTWEMFGVSVHVDVKELEDNKRILMEWGNRGQTSVVEWLFTSRPDNTTMVKVTNSGFHGSADDVVKSALDSTQGFNLVLCGAKALLEHGIKLNLIRDRYPDVASK